MTDLRTVSSSSVVADTKHLTPSITRASIDDEFSQTLDLIRLKNCFATSQVMALS